MRHLIFIVLLCAACGKNTHSIEYKTPLSTIELIADQQNQIVALETFVASLNAEILALQAEIDALNAIECKQKHDNGNHNGQNKGDL